MSDTKALVERLEGGETGREIEVGIFHALSGDEQLVKLAPLPADEQWHWLSCYRGAWIDVSTSLDAALALVERVRPGLFWAVSREHPDFLREGEHLCSASVYGAVEWSSHEGYDEPHIPSSDARAPSPAAALLAALLKSGS